MSQQSIPLRIPIFLVRGTYTRLFTSTRRWQETWHSRYHLEKPQTVTGFGLAKATVLTSLLHTRGHVGGSSRSEPGGYSVREQTTPADVPVPRAATPDFGVCRKPRENLQFELMRVARLCLRTGLNLFKTFDIKTEVSILSKLLI